MKIKSVIIDDELAISENLRKFLFTKFPDVLIKGQASTATDACKLIKAVNPDLVFSNVNVFNKNSRLVDADIKHFQFELVYMSNRYEDAISAIQEDVCGFILKPLMISDLIRSVGCAIQKLSERSSFKNLPDQIPQGSSGLPHNNLIGIPTIEGIDFLNVQEIIRCEGLQKCTCIVSTRKQNLVSSYNIGEFKKLLEEAGFFSCHKSHLINLMHVRKFTREGFVFLTDNSPVPLARRRRLEFLHLLRHL